MKAFVTIHYINTHLLGGYYKFVKVDGEYRFIEVKVGTESHTDIVGELEYDKVEAAGDVGIFSGYWKLCQTHSTSLLNSGVATAVVDQDVIEELSELFTGRDYKEKY